MVISGHQWSDRIGHAPQQLALATARMLHLELASAFIRWAELGARYAKAKLLQRRVLTQLLKGILADVFYAWAEAVGQEAARQARQATLLRKALNWMLRSYLVQSFDAWNVFQAKTQEARTAREEAAAKLARQLVLRWQGSMLHKLFRVWESAHRERRAVGKREWRRGEHLHAEESSRWSMRAVASVSTCLRPSRSLFVSSTHISKQLDKSRCFMRAIALVAACRCCTPSAMKRRHRRQIIAYLMREVIRRHRVDEGRRQTPSAPRDRRSDERGHQTPSAPPDPLAYVWFIQCRIVRCNTSLLLWT